MEYSHKSILLTLPSRAFGSIQRYIQGPGELNNVFEYGKKIRQPLSLSRGQRRV